MSSSWFSVESVSTWQTILAQVPEPAPDNVPKESLWTYSTIGLAITLIGLLIYGRFKIGQVKKEVKFEQFKSKDFKKKLKLALHTIKKMETNPDLVHSRAFNLDYLRMRMDEEVFHYVIVNQIKIKVSQLIGEALRPNTSKNAVGIIAGDGKSRKFSMLPMKWKLKKENGIKGFCSVFRSN